MFLSSLTESQVISAVCGFAASLFLILVDALVYVVSTPAFRTLFSYMSFNDRYNGFTYGIIDFSNVLFFVSIAALFLLLTTAVLGISIFIQFSPGYALINFGVGYILFQLLAAPLLPAGQVLNLTITFLVALAVSLILSTHSTMVLSAVS